MWIVYGLCFYGHCLSFGALMGYNIVLNKAL